MDEMSIGDILKDFSSIKLSKVKRLFIEQCKTYWGEHGNLPRDMKVQLRTMTMHYSLQFNELHKSRANAKKTLWRKKQGVTIRDAHKMVAERRQMVAAQKADVGL